MKTLHNNALLAGAAALALTMIAGQAFAQAAKPQPAAAVAAGKPKVTYKPGQHPDFTGRWLQDQGILFSDPTPKHHSGSHPGWDDSINPPPFNAEQQEKYAKSNHTPDRKFDCDPPGMPRLMANPFPMQIAFGLDRMFMIFEYKNQQRTIYLDGRKHPDEDDFDNAWNGHSVGHWEGDTLVVDTTNISNRPGALIQITGIGHSDQLHIVERIKMLGPNQIADEMTFIDPKVFTKPWVNARSFTRQSSAVDVPEYVCLTSELIDELHLVPQPKK